MPFIPSARIGELGLTLPDVPQPVGSYVPYKIINMHLAGMARNFLYTSGMIPVVDGQPLHAGKVGSQVSIEQAQECARICVLNALAWVDRAVNGINHVHEVIQVRGFVACTPEFADHPQVINGASDLLVDIFGDAGRHTRSSVGCSSLPLNVPVEIDFLFAL